MSATDPPRIPGRPFAAGDDPRRSPGKPFSQGADPRRTGAFSDQHQPRGTPWQPGEISALGTAADHLIAARLGRSRLAVIAKRRELGIAAHQGKGRPRKNG
jgi:hypothetical protein